MCNYTKLTPAFTLTCALVFSSVSHATTLVDDTFGDGALGTNPDTGSGFTAITHNTGSASEIGGNAQLSSGSQNFANVGIYSNDAINFTAYSAVTATFVVSSVTGEPDSNGLFFGFNENATDQYRLGAGHNNFGFILENNEGFNGRIGITANDWGNATTGNRDGDVQLDIASVNLADIQDGFTLSFTVYSNDTFDWTISGLGAADGSGTSIAMASGITYASQFDSDDRAFAHGQRGSTTGAITMNVDSITVTAIPEPGTYAMFAGALALVSVIVRRRRA